MIKMTIVEAATEALRLLSKPSSIKQIYAKVLERSLYKFGAKDPLAVLRVQIEDIVSKHLGLVRLKINFL